MTLIKLLKPAAIGAAIVIFAAMFSGCGSSTSDSSEPTLAPTTEAQSRVSLDDRAEAKNGYGYESLDTDQKRSVYDTIGEYMHMSETEEFVLDDVTLAVFDEALGAYEADHPEEFWLDLGSRYSYVEYSESIGFELNFELEGDELNTAKETFSKKVDEITASAPEEASDYQMEIFVNDYLIDNCDYQSDASMKHNAYGALVNGAAVCDGYAKAFQILCNRLGIECVGVNGYCPDFNKENGESADTGHMWNCAKIGGDWYHVDVTWNDGDAHIQRYLYLNLTTEEIKKNHTISPLYNDNEDPKDIYNVFVPECTSEEYNYFKREYVTINNLDESDELLAAFLQAVRNGDEYFDFLISEDLDYAEATQAISESYGYQWIEQVNEYNSGGAQISTDSKFYTYENINAVTFRLEYIE